MNESITNALQTKCKSCGGVMQYSPTHENLKCLFCESEIELDKTAAEIIENDFDYWKDRADENENAVANTDDNANAGNNATIGMNAGSHTNTASIVETSEIKCRQCGATTSLPANVSGAKCVFCGTPLIMDEATVKRFWQPNYLLPFKISEKESGKNFSKWLAGKWLAPSVLKKNAVGHDAFKGVYLPFWTYDANTTTDYRGQRGKNRKEKYKNEKGETIERTVTDWYTAYGTVDVEFDDVLVPATQTLPAHIASQLTNWDMTNCVAFRKEFLAGFVTEIYQRDFRECLDDAQKNMDSQIEEAINENIGGDKQRIDTKSTRYNEVKFKHLLLPVWISAFKFRNNVYQFVVNGRTGQVVGDYPKDKAKIAMIILAIIALIAALWWFSG